MSTTLSLQFSTSTAWQSAVIRCLTHSPFSHVDIVLEDGNLLGASDSKDAPVIKGNPRGVAIRPPNYEQFGIKAVATVTTDKADAIVQAAMGQLGKAFDNSALWGFLVDPLLPDDRTWMNQWMGSRLLGGLADRLVEHLVSPYEIKSFVGHPGIISSWAGEDKSAKSWRDEGQWFCAELAAWVIESGGYWDPRKLGWPLSRISPTDLLLLFAVDDNFVNRNQFWSTLENALAQGTLALQGAAK
jgi:hypothetical protein